MRSSILPANLPLRTKFPQNWRIRAFIALLVGSKWATVVSEEKRGIILRQFNACLPPVINFLQSSEEILALPPLSTPPTGGAGLCCSLRPAAELSVWVTLSLHPYYPTLSCGPAFGGVAREVTRRPRYNRV